MSEYVYAETLQPSGRRRLFAEISTKQTHKHSRSPPNEWPARRRGRYLHKTQQTQEMNIHTVCGIRTRDPSNPATGDACFRRPSHWERFVTDIWTCNLMASANEWQCHLVCGRSRTTEHWNDANAQRSSGCRWMMARKETYSHTEFPLGWS